MNLTKLKDQLPIKWRLQNAKYSSAVCVAYVDARDVMDRLDAVFGVGGWQRDHKEVKGNLYAGIGVKIENEWRWFWDCGTESNTEKQKGEASDSFKRAAVNLGIGRYIYDMPLIKLPKAQYKNKDYPADDKGKPIFSGEDLTTYINANFEKLAGGSDIGQPTGPVLRMNDFEKPAFQKRLKATLKDNTPKEAIKKIKAVYTGGIDKDVEQKILSYDQAA